MRNSKAVPPVVVFEIQYLDNVDLENEFMIKIHYCNHFFCVFFQERTNEKSKLNSCAWILSEIRQQYHIPSGKQFLSYFSVSFIRLLGHSS